MRAHSHLLFPVRAALRDPHSFPTRRSSDLKIGRAPELRSARERDPEAGAESGGDGARGNGRRGTPADRERKDRQGDGGKGARSEEHTSELQSRRDLVCRLLLEKKKYSSGP